MVVGADIDLALGVVEAAGNGVAAEHTAVLGVLTGADDEELGAGADEEQDHGGIAALDAAPDWHADPVWEFSRGELFQDSQVVSEGSGISVGRSDLHDVELGMPLSRL